MALRTVNVTIATVYLYENLENARENWGDLEVLRQTGLFGYDPDNLGDSNLIITSGKRSVILNSPNSGGSLTLENIAGSDLVIAGNVESSELGVRLLMGECGIHTGTIVARYSIFYGGPSKYTGRLPEDAGYALDIPKNTSTVKKMLSDDYFLASILDRNEDAIVDSVNKINRNLEDPILITPYLTKVLEVNRQQLI